MKKFVNVRFMVLLALALVLGTALSCVFTFYRISQIWLITAVAAATLSITAFSLLKRNYKPLVYIILMLALFFAGFYNCNSRLTAYANSEIVSSNTYLITGKVTEKQSTDSYEYIIVDNVNANGTELEGKIFVRLYQSYGEFCDVGYTVEFFAAITHYDEFPYGKLNSNTENNIKYSCSVTGGLRSKYGFSLFGYVRSVIRETLYESLDKDTASVCYAMFTGSTYEVDSGSMQSFRYGGIAHIFAVSGLHIGIIYGIIDFICRKLKLNKTATAIICIMLVILYAGVCGWNPSSLRAAIMCATAAICKLIFVKYDGLNALAFAVVILLIINPLSLFSVGFQLSVCAVGGIYCFSGVFKKLFQRIRCPEKISSGICTSFGAQIGTLPVLLANFGYISGAGLILNIVLLPALSALFSFLFVCTVFCAIISAAAPFILPIAAVPMQAVLSFLVSAGFEKALISGFGAGFFILLWYIAALFLSDKVNLKPLIRIIGTGFSAIVLAAFVLIQVYSPFSGYKVIVSAGGQGGEVIIKTHQGSILVVTEGASASSVSTAINNYYAFNPKGIIILGGENCIEYLDKLDTEFSDVYVCMLYLNIQPNKHVTVHYERNFELCGVNFEFSDGYSLIVNLGSKRLGICANENIPIRNCDLLISKYLNTTCTAVQTVYFNLRGYEYNVYEYGDVIFKYN